jgi:O-antigen/teichoic acid export membrane protein
MGVRPLPQAEKRSLAELIQSNRYELVHTGPNAAAACVLLWRLPGAIWALAIMAAVTCLLSQISLRRQCTARGIRPRFSSALAEVRTLWTFSLPILMTGALAADPCSSD